MFFSDALGSKYSFESNRFMFNYYHSLGKRQVLAYNLYTCATAGDPPFYGERIYGTNSELRGYVAGRYIDRDMIATQVEYRLAIRWRFGIVLLAARRNRAKRRGLQSGQYPSGRRRRPEIQSEKKVQS